MLLEIERKEKKEIKLHVDLAANSGGTALMFASGAGKDACVKSLLAAGSDLNMLVEAKPEGNFGEVAALLVENGAVPNDAYFDEEGVEHNLLHDSIIVENHEFSKLLIENGATLDHVDSSGVIILLQAAHRGMTEIVSLVLEYDKSKTVDIEAPNVDGISALIAAASEGHSVIVKSLLAAKANVNTVDKDSTTALMAAAVRGHKEIIADLLTAGAEINSQNVDGHSAIMFAYNGYMQVQTLWVKYQSYLEDSNEADDEANSKFIQDALANHTAVVDILTKNGADLTLKDKEGHTAADFDYHPELDGDALEAAKGEEKRKKRTKKKGKDEEL